MTTTPIQQEAERLGGFYVPRFEVKIEGANLPRDVLFDVRKLTYRDDVEGLDGFDLVVNNWDAEKRAFTYLGSETKAMLEPGHPDHARVTLFEPCGKEVEIRLGYGNDFTTMLKGTFTTMQPSYGDGAAELTVSGLNVLHQLRRKQYTTNWVDKRDSEIAQDIAQRTDNGRPRFPLPIHVDDDALGKEKPIPLVTQHNTYDIDFLFQRARRRGYVVFIQEADPAAGRERRLYFGPSRPGLIPGIREVTFEFVWGRSLLEFKPTIRTANQVSSVTVRGWHRTRREPISRTVTLDDERITANTDLHRVINACDAARGAGGRRARLHQLRGPRAGDRDPARPDQGDGHRRGEGRRHARPACRTDRGDRRPGRAPVRQVLRDQVRAHRRRLGLPHLLHRPAGRSVGMNERLYGVVVGIVIDVDDADGQARVKLRFPWLAEEGAESGWAPIARPMAGNDRGYYYQPEVDDEALVAFEHGDVNHPMVLGFLHNGVDVPPQDGIDKHVRRLKSVAGHAFELDDRDGQESVRLYTDGGHQLELHDPDGAVELHTSGGQKVRLQDQPARVEVSTTTGTTITVDDAPSQIELRTVAGVSVTISDTGGVSVSAPAGQVSVESLSASVTSSTSVSVTAPSMSVDAASLQVNAALARFAGVVQCQTLISSAVVSTSYTPGAGNIW